MNGDNVLVKVKTSQYRDDGTEDIIEKTYHGSWMKKNGCIYISFVENEDGDEKKDIIKITEDEVIIMRRYEAISNMRFSEGKKHRTQYHTEYNMFEIVLDTKKILRKIDENSIRLTIDYNISILGLMDANNIVTIDITKKGV